VQLIVLLACSKCYSRILMDKAIWKIMFFLNNKQAEMCTRHLCIEKRRRIFLAVNLLHFYSNLRYNEYFFARHPLVYEGRIIRKSSAEVSFAEIPVWKTKISEISFKQCSAEFRISVSEGGNFYPSSGAPTLEAVM